MFLKNHFAGNARGNLLLALKVIIAKTKFLSFCLTKYEAHNKPFTFQTRGVLEETYINEALKE